MKQSPAYKMKAESRVKHLPATQQAAGRDSVVCSVIGATWPRALRYKQGGATRPPKTTTTSSTTERQILGQNSRKTLDAGRSSKSAVRPAHMIGRCDPVPPSASMETAHPRKATQAGFHPIMPNRNTILLCVGHTRSRVIHHLPVVPGPPEVTTHVQALHLKEQTVALVVCHPACGTRSRTQPKQ